MISGNPRNKCALAPGHSLMDWIRLGNSGKDLTSVGEHAGKLLISEEELSKHNTQEDAWLSIRGNVYNVTHYLSFHPGGISEILRGAGIDATKLFDEIHPWVNYNQILGKCYIGKLKPKITSKPINVINTIPLQAAPPPPPSLEDTINVRFDWIQKSEMIYLYFYTGPNSNPYLRIYPPNSDKIIKFLIQIKNHLFSYDVKFMMNVVWPPQFKIFYESGRIEVVFNKVESGIWSDYGTMEVNRMEGQFQPQRHMFQFEAIRDCTHDTRLFQAKRVDGVLHNSPIGLHVRIYNDDADMRSYTPIPCSAFDNYGREDFTTSSLCFLIKLYPHGVLTNYIFSKQKGDLISISEPIGTFDLKAISDYDKFLLIAGGTGLTPFLSLILYILERNSKPCKNITLLFYNKSEEDIVLYEKLFHLMESDTRFKVEFVLTKPSTSWNGRTGRINSAFITEIMERDFEGANYKTDIHYSICGPDGFIQATNLILTNELKIALKRVYIFPG